MCAGDEDVDAVRCARVEEIQRICNMFEWISCIYDDDWAKLYSAWNDEYEKSEEMMKPKCIANQVFN